MRGGLNKVIPPARRTRPALRMVRRQATLPPTTMWRFLLAAGILSTVSLAYAVAEPESGADREEAVSFDDEAPAAGVANAVRTIPELETRRWLVILPLMVLGLLAWNVRWRRGQLSARYAPPIGVRRVPKGRPAPEHPTEDF
jgi:hypothetical protein